MFLIIVPSAQVHIVDVGHFSLDTAANEIAARVREFMDMPKESIPGEEIMGTATTPARPPCSNVAATRANLLKAFAAAFLEAKWTEWERSSPSSPAYAAGFGSPTVLVEGRDVAGENPTQYISGCRLYASAEGRYSGTPSVELILSYLVAEERPEPAVSLPVSGKCRT
jgi:hypothetical protein